MEGFAHFGCSVLERKIQRSGSGRERFRREIYSRTSHLLRRVRVQLLSYQSLLDAVFRNHTVKKKNSLVFFYYLLYLLVDLLSRRIKLKYYFFLIYLNSIFSVVLTLFFFILFK